MTHSLHLKNFKCFTEQSFSFGALTLLSGLNGSGKSSVLQSLLLLRQSYLAGLLQRGRLCLNGDLVELGTVKEMVYEGAKVNLFGFSLSFAPKAPDQNRRQISWNFRIEPPAGKAEAVAEEISPTPMPNSLCQESLFNENFHYLQAERIGERRSVAYPHSYGQIGTRGEYTCDFLAAFGSQEIILHTLAHPSARSLSLVHQVEAWMSEISPAIGLGLKMGKQLTKGYHSVNVGFGITYTLPVLVALLSAAPKALILLEHPAAHLHPQGQARLGELIARAASCGIQIVIESHSDHLLNGVRIAVYEGRLKPEDVQLYFLDRQQQNEHLYSKVIAPRMLKNGRIDRWPDGFFDQWDKSLERLLTPLPRKEGG